MFEGPGHQGYCTQCSAGFSPFNPIDWCHSVNSSRIHGGNTAEPVHTCTMAQLLSTLHQGSKETSGTWW